MKNLKLFIFFLCVSGVFLNLNAQGIINDKKDLSPSFDNNQQQFNFFSQQINEASRAAIMNVANNGVFINQIGAANTTNITTQSQISDIKLTQLGNSNQIDLNLKATIIDYSVTQLGNNNLLLEYNTFNDKRLIQRTVQQNGDNQNLIIHGNNGIVDKMKINMNKDSRSLIIRNSN